MGMTVRASFHHSHLTEALFFILSPFRSAAPICRLSRFLPGCFTVRSIPVRSRQPHSPSSAVLDILVAIQLRVLFLSLLHSVLVFSVQSNCNSSFRRIFTRGTDPVVVQWCVPRPEPLWFRNSGY